MTDSFGEDAQVPVPSEPKPKSPVAAFLASTSGKLIVGGVLLFVVLAVTGTLLFTFLVNKIAQVDTAVVPVARKGVGSSAPTMTPVNPRVQPLDDTFTFRNVFAPTVKPPKEPAVSDGSDSDSTSTETSSSTSGAKDTLILQSISVEDGVRTATFEWNGETYAVVEGGQIADSPWKVLEIDSDSALMLYGDSRVTLTVGQGFSDGGQVSK